MGLSWSQFSDLFSRKNDALMSFEVTVAHVVVSSALLMIPVWYINKYRRSIRKRVRAIDETISKAIMTRVELDPTDPSPQTNKHNGPFSVRLLELNPAFVRAHAPRWKLLSLGQYVSSLRPLPGVLDSGVDLPVLIQRELEAAVGQQLLRGLGPRFGAAALPVLGIPGVRGWTSRIASSAASWFAAHMLFQPKKENEDEKEPDRDKGVLPIGLYELSAFANMHEKWKGGDTSRSPLGWLKLGEVGYSPSFADVPDEKAPTTTTTTNGHHAVPDQKPMNGRDENGTKTNGDGLNGDATKLNGSESASETAELVPNPFVIARHWNAAISSMEELEAKQQMAPGDNTTTTTPYDPHSRSYPPPQPVHERLLPDLYRGWGDAECTHTKREVLRNRLLCVLMNRLSYNYYIQEQNLDEELFTVKMKKTGKALTTVRGFVQALIDTGHSIEVCPRSTITTFGTAACVKNKDGSFSNIPLACFFKSGYEDGNGRSGHFAAPHGGMDFNLTGPLVGRDDTGKDNKCNIQFYIAIEGMCGWHSNHNANVPWIQPVTFGEPYNRDTAMQAIQMTSVLAVVLNAIGTERKLPFGGYGIVGVCGDTAALMDQALRGETKMYPLMSTGRYLMHITRRFGDLFQKMGQKPGVYRSEMNAIAKLMTASMSITSDLHASPADLLTTADRYLGSLAEIPTFALETETQDLMDTLRKQFYEFETKGKWTA